MNYALDLEFDYIVICNAFYVSRYTIVGGNFASNFSIDKISGKIEPIGIIDFESVPDDTQNSLQFSPR